MYRPHFITALVSLIGSFFSRWRRPTGPGPQMFMEEPPVFRHGNSKRVRLPMTKYRRWRRGWMQMQRESRRRNRAER